MFNLQLIREAIGRHLGRVLTPDAALDIERAVLAEPDDSLDPRQFPPELRGDFVIRVESFREIRDELEVLHRLHWQETELHRHQLPMRPDYAHMASAERAGEMLQFTARQEGRLVGHLRMFIYEALHTQTLAAEEDTLFLLPEVRGGYTAMHLLRYAETCLRAVGVREISADSKLVNKADVLMRRMGYTPVAMKFTKVFEEGRHVL